MFNKGDRIVHRTIGAHGTIKELFVNNRGIRFWHIDWIDLELSGKMVPAEESTITIDKDYYSQLKIDNRNKLISDILCQ